MKVIAAAGVAVVALVIAYFASPYWAFHQMRSAAHAGEGDRLSQYIDFPAVRESLKSQLAVRVNKSMSSVSKDNPFAALGQMLATTMIGTMVDAMITPESLASMINRGKTDAQPKPGPEPRPDQAATTETSSKATVEILERYEGMDIFKVGIRNADSSDEGVTFVLNRNGWFGWKVTAVRLPDFDKPK